MNTGTLPAGGDLPIGHRSRETVIEYPQEVSRVSRERVNLAIAEAEASFVEAETHRAGFTYDDRCVALVVDVMNVITEEVGGTLRVPGAWRAENARQCVERFYAWRIYEVYQSKSPQGPWNVRTQRSSVLPGDITYTDVRLGNEHTGLVGFQRRVNQELAGRDWWRELHREIAALARAQAEPPEVPPLDETLDRRKARRSRLLEEFQNATGLTKNRNVYAHSDCPIHKPQFYQWLNGRLSNDSTMTANFERFLREGIAGWPDSAS